MSVGGLDWEALGDEAVDLLRRYLAIDTTNPPGNEADGVRFLSEVLAAHDLPSEIVASAPRRANLVASPDAEQARCERRVCETDAQCDGGYCVRGLSFLDNGKRCFAQPGSCMLPPP